MSTTADVRIIYHSQSASNQQLASAALRGASKARSAKIAIARACDTSTKDLLNTKAIILCFAEMNASIAGGMKEFFDRVYYPLTAQQKILPYALCMSVGNDGSGALRQFDRIATGLGLKATADAIIVKGEASSEQLTAVEDLAEALAEGVLMGIY